MKTDHDKLTNYLMSLSGDDNLRFIGWAAATLISDPLVRLHEVVADFAKNCPQAPAIESEPLVP